VTQAIVVLHPTEGNNTSGIVTFTQYDCGVLIEANVTGLPQGQVELFNNHGFHIHTFGNCSTADSAAAGGHYDPTNQPHGCPNNPHRHVGDMGNLVSDEFGNANYSAFNELISLNGPNSVIGRSVIVHRDRDNCVTQPTGDSGPRVACGVIGIAAEVSKHPIVHHHH